MTTFAEMAAGARLIADFLTFENFVSTLEKISLADNNEKKKRALEGYVRFLREQYRNHHKTLDADKAGGDSLYCVVRILLPDVDRGRRAYGFKSTSLGRMFAQILGLDKNSQAGKRLLNFKDPKSAGDSAGDISNAIFEILTRRCSTKSDDKVVHLSELHETLDKLAKGTDPAVNQEYQKKVLQGLIRKLTPLEGKWLVRILLKDMRLGFSSTKNAVYSLLHPQAKRLSESVGDLELLCRKLNDPSAQVEDIEVLLFNHFMPMLATRMDIIDSAFESGGNGNGNSSNRQSKKSEVVLPAPPFYVETKWDGERFQIHYNGNEFKYLSRRAFDFSSKFNETLTPKLSRQIKPGIRSFILDGEMMAFNLTHKIFTQKGYNIDVKTMNKDNQNHCPVFVAFDVVYLNGVVLTKMPLKERRAKLTDVFKVKEDTVRISEVKMMNTKEEVIACLDSAIDDGEEGLIVKDARSIYEPGKRPLTWLKIKPEYLEDNSVDDLDLVILGAYYTDSARRGGELTHFLVGLLDKSKGRNEYYPVAKVGSGRLRSLAVKDLIEELKPRFTQTPPSNVHIKSRKKPDFMIDPAKSVVVQVKASEIIPSDVYSCNYTLRFPRIIKIRKDKSPGEIMELAEFIRIKEACGGKLARRTDGKGGTSRHPFFKKKRYHSDFENSEEDDDDDDDKPQNKKSAPSYDNDDEMEDDALPDPSKALVPIRKPLITLAKSPQKPSGSTAKPIVSPQKSTISAVQNNIFDSKMFCVYGLTKWKTEMEAKIRAHGGDISQSPDVKGVFAIVGMRRNSPHVSVAIRSGNYDVMLPSWVDKCIKMGKEIPPVPLDYWAMKEETKDSFKDEYDEYGDSYTKENTIEENKAIIRRMFENENAELIEDSDHSMSDNDESAESGHGSDSGSSTDFSDYFNLTEGVSVPEKKEDKAFKESLGSYNFLSEVLLVFRGTCDKSLKSNFEFHGGKVAEDENDPKLTHVIVCKEGDPSKEDHSRAMVVCQKWLEDCLTKNKVLDERKYLA